MGILKWFYHISDKLPRWQWCECFPNSSEWLPLPPVHHHDPHPPPHHQGQHLLHRGSEVPWARRHDLHKKSGREQVRLISSDISNISKYFPQIFSDAALAFIFWPCPAVRHGNLGRNCSDFSWHFSDVWQHHPPHTTLLTLGFHGHIESLVVYTAVCLIYPFCVCLIVNIFNLYRINLTDKMWKLHYCHYKWYYHTKCYYHTIHITITM